MTARARNDSGERSGASTSRSLIAHAQQSDPMAWERLIRLYAPLVASWCRRWGVAEQDIADLLQDVFSAVSGHLGRFHRDRPHDTFRGWLLIIARSKFSDHVRRKAREPDVTGGTEFSHRLQQFAAAKSPELESQTRAADDADWDAVLQHALAAIRGEFQPGTWQAFWETAVHGRAAADVARDLGMKPGAVRVAKSRVLHRLRRELGDRP
jgi:RNA polymerase sigma-70 factor (ECF subfamily)